ncbi:MAG: hypothetical protein WD795_12585 [Woeseia sp.]
MSVHYELGGETTEVEFKVDSFVIRDQYWTVDSPFELRGDRITAPEAFTQATATLQPNDRIIDRVYPSLTTVDATTSVINLDYVRLKNDLEPVSITVRNAYDPYEQVCVEKYDIPPAKGTEYPDSAGRYVLLSSTYDACAAHVNNGPPKIFFSRDMSPPIVKLISGSLLPAYDGIKKQFEVRPEPEPTIFLSQDRGGVVNEYQGDAGWDSIISLRFQGDAWDTPDEVDSNRVLTFLTHELVHLWIGKLLRTDTGNGPERAWLHEGAADYIALIELVSQGSLSREYFLSRMGERANACGQIPGTRYLMTDREPAAGSLVYDCGVLVQLVYDAVSRAESDNERTIVDLWRDFVKTSIGDGTHAIRAEQFVDSYPNAKRILSGVFYGPEIDMNSIAAELRTLGVDAILQESTDVGTLVMGIMDPFFRVDCETGSFGFWTNKDHLALDANDSCQSIPPGFVLRYIQGLDVLEQPGNVYRAVEEICAQGGSIRLTGRTSDEPGLTLPCAGPLPPPPLNISFRNVSFLGY